MRKIIVLLTFLLATCVQAQNLRATSIQAFLGYDHGPMLENNRDVACRLNLIYGKNAKADFGIRYTSEHVLSSELGLYFPLVVSEDHKLYLKANYLYRQFYQHGITEFSSSLLANCNTPHWNMLVGLANRYYCEHLWSVHQENNTILEPMSFCYYFEYYVKRTDSKWNASFALGNIDYFLIDRASRFRPSINLFYRHQRQQYSLHLGTHPSGMLNLASVYDGAWIRFAINHNFTQQQ